MPVTKATLLKMREILQKREADLTSVYALGDDGHPAKIVAENSDGKETAR